MEETLSSKTKGKSLINIRHSKGSNMDPYGTPHVTLPFSDVLLFTDTTWILLSKYDSINLIKLLSYL